MCGWDRVGGAQRFSVSAFMLLARPQQPPADACWDLPQAFNGVFEKAIQRAVPSEDTRQRVANLTDQITYSVYVYTAQGLFERDKLIFLAQVAFQVIPANVGGSCSTTGIHVALDSLLSYSGAAVDAQSPEPLPLGPWALGGCDAALPTSRSWPSRKKWTQQSWTFSCASLPRLVSRPPWTSCSSRAGVLSR